MKPVLRIKYLLTVKQLLNMVPYVIAIVSLGGPYQLLKLKLIYDRQSVGQSMLVPGTHLGPVTNFSFSLRFSLDSCGVVIL
jgi:hypothetical protein